MSLFGIFYILGVIVAFFILIKAFNTTVYPKEHRLLFSITFMYVCGVMSLLSWIIPLLYIVLHSRERNNTMKCIWCGNILPENRKNIALMIARICTERQNIRQNLIFSDWQKRMVLL